MERLLKIQNAGLCGYVEWLEEAKPTDDDLADSGAVERAGRRGHIKVFEWLKKRDFDHYLIDYCGISSAAGEGQIELLEWFAAQVTPDQFVAQCRIAAALQWAAHGGQVAVLDWLEARGCAGVEDCKARHNGMIKDAANWGRVAVLDWLNARGLVTLASCRDAHAVAFAASEFVEGLLWLDEHGCVEPADCVDNDCEPLLRAARWGNCAGLDWLWEKGGRPALDVHEKWVAVGVPCAASHGSTAVLDWFLSHGLSAADFRAGNCAALRAAAASGRVEVLDWLEANGLATAADCATFNFEAVNLSAYAGHVAVLDWLFKRDHITPQVVFDLDLINNSAVKGQLEVLDWLAARGFAGVEELRGPPGPERNITLYNLVRCASAGTSNASLCEPSVDWLFARGLGEADAVDACNDRFDDQPLLYWRAHLRRRLLVVVLCGRRLRARGYRGHPRLPAEIWEYIGEFAAPTD